MKRIKTETGRKSERAKKAVSPIAKRKYVKKTKSQKETFDVSKVESKDVFGMVKEFVSRLIAKIKSLL